MSKKDFTTAFAVFGYTLAVLTGIGAIVIFGIALDSIQWDKSYSVTAAARLACEYKGECSTETVNPYLFAYAIVGLLFAGFLAALTNIVLQIFNAVVKK